MSVSRECPTEWSKSEREGEISYDIPLCGILKKKNDTKELKKYRHSTDSENKLTVTGKVEREGSVGENGHGHTAVFNMENQQAPAVWHREVCSILCNKLMVTRGKEGGRDIQGVWDGHGHTAVFNMENQRAPAGQPRELCSMSSGSLDARGVWGRVDTCIWMAESLPHSLTTITSLLIGYTPIQNK